MLKSVVLAAVLAVVISDVTSQRIILPTYRPPVTRGPVIRTARDAGDEPMWLWKGDDVPRAPSTADHPVLPSYIDDVHLDQNRRHARSLDSPSSKRSGGGRPASGSRDTGPTHPGYNRRNARSIAPLDLPGRPSPFDPTFPRPYDPRPGYPRGPYPIYARTARDIHIPELKKPTHRDVIIPNWNPNVKTSPWEHLGRKPRSLDEGDDEIYHHYYNVAEFDQ